MNKAAAKRAQREYKTRPQLCVEMLEILASHCPHRRFHAVVDTAYGGKSVVAHLPGNIDITRHRPPAARPLRPRGSPSPTGSPVSAAHALHRA